MLTFFLPCISVILAELFAGRRCIMLHSLRGSASCSRPTGPENCRAPDCFNLAPEWLQREPYVPKIAEISLKILLGLAKSRSRVFFRAQWLPRVIQQANKKVKFSTPKTQHEKRCWSTKTSPANHHLVECVGPREGL